MGDSDQNDGEAQKTTPPPETSTDNVTVSQKRVREELSEDELLPAKKACTTVDEHGPECHESESTREVNGAADSAEKNENSLEDKEESEKKSIPMEVTDEKSDEKSDKNSESADSQEEDSEKDNVNMENDKTTEEVTDKREKDSPPDESVSATNAKGSKEDDEDSQSQEDDDKEEVGKNGNVLKSKKQGTEIVGGLELSVECASDKESSSSDSEAEKEKKPRTKTIIVKEKPNESELDVSSSEAEKSDSQDAAEQAVPSKQSAKKGRRKGSRTSFSKAKGSGSEDSLDNVSDEDYSPRTKKRLKRTAAAKKAAKGSPESKRGRGRGKRGSRKSIEKEPEQDEDVDETNNKKSAEEASDGASAENKSENDSEGENVSKDGKRRRRRNVNPDDDKKIQSLKKYIRAAGIYVKSYNDLWAGCKSNATRVECLRDLLEKHGVTGRPSLEKCKKVKERNERLKDVSELNTSNILSEGRITRARKNMDKDVAKTPETPTKQREARSTFKRILTVVDSDSE